MENSEYKKLVEDGKKYLETRVSLLKLDLLDKLSQIIGIIVLVLIVALLLMTALAFFAAAAVGALCNLMPMWVACVIVGSLFVILIVLCIAFQTKWFVNPIIRRLSGIIFPEETEEKEVANE